MQLKRNIDNLSIDFGISFNIPCNNYKSSPNTIKLTAKSCSTFNLNLLDKYMFYKL